MPLFDVDGLCYLDRGPIGFSLEPGRCLGVSGPSGCGKSLLLKCLADLFPHQGRITLDGVGMMEVPAPRWRRQVGLLPAESRWWHDRVADHFSSDPPPLASLDLPDGLLGQTVSRLSSGERQRLALLRMLQNQPRALLLDEPTANLDTASARLVEKALADYLEEHGAAAVWVGHNREQLFRVADRCLRFQDGTLTEDPGL